MTYAERGTNSFYIDDNLAVRLDGLKEKVAKKDKDYFFSIDGEEGSGKSVFAMQLAMYVDPSFCVERIVFTPEDFTEAVMKAQKGQAIVFDEAFRGLSSRGALSEVNRLLVTLMMECRQKNLFVFVVMPSFFLLDKYVALWRAKGLFHVYEKRGQRGYWIYFNKKKKKILYLKGKQDYSYAYPKSNFKGKFLDKYTVPEDDYRKRKAEAFLSMNKKKKTPAEERMKTEYFEQRNLLLWLANREMGLSTYEISKKMAGMGWKIAHNTISDAVNKKEDELKEKGLL